MRVFLGNAPWRKGNRYGVRAGSRWPFTTKLEKGQKKPCYIPFPFFLAYATAVLEKNGIDVFLVDAIAEGMENDEFVKKVIDFAPDLVLLETSTPSINIDLVMAKRLKEETGSQIALSGPHVSMFQKEILEENKFVDYILVGEYEYTLLELVRHLEDKNSLKAVAGLVYRENDESIQINPRRPVIENLDELPWPAYHLLPMHTYNDAFCSLPTPSLQMWASRGCPYKCIFCMWPDVMYGGHRYRTRDPVKVVDEMEWCIKEYCFKSVYFDDDTFNLDKKRILKLAEEIKRRKLDTPWSIMARADTMDQEMLEAMRVAGLYALKYGVESGAQEILDASGKNLNLNKVEKIVKITKDLGIKVHLTFTFGLPGETRETIQKTINFFKELDTDSIQFSIVTPFPGTKYFELLKEKGFLHTENWSDFDGNSRSVMRTDQLTSEDLEQALIKVWREWERHQIKKAFLKDRWKYFLKGVKHPLKAIKGISDLL